MAMGERLKRWFSRPPIDQPAEVLRWVRRISLAVAGGGLLVAAQIWATDGSPPWALLAAFGAAVAGAATMGPAIREAERRGPVTDPVERKRLRRRGDRAQWLVSAAVTIGCAVFGYIVDGVTGAAFLVCFALVSSALGIWFYQRWGR